MSNLAHRDDFSTKLYNYFTSVNAEIIPSKNDLDLSGRYVRFAVHGRSGTPGWYVASKVDVRGSWEIVLNAGVYGAKDSQRTITTFGSMRRLSKEDKATVDKVLEENKKKIEEAKQEAYARCVQDARAIINNKHTTIATKDNAYIKSKNINPYNSLDSHGTLIIPMHNKEKGIISFQRVIDNKDGTFTKKYNKGTEKRGAFNCLSSIDELEDADYCYLTEGYATGCTIQEAFPRIPVVVSFDSGNLKHVCAVIREYNPGIRIIIAADKDVSKDGEYKAKDCLKSFNEITYILPKFIDEVIQGTKPKDRSDFNDLANLQDISDVQKQLKYRSNLFYFVKPLGITQAGKFAFLSSYQNSVFKFNATEFSRELSFYAMIPDRAFWLNYAPHAVSVKEDKNTGEPELKVNWTEIGRTLLQDSSTAGAYNADKVRGVGVWQDGDSIVINDGSSIKGEPSNSKYIYVPTNPSGLDVPKKHEAGCHKTIIRFINESHKHLPFVSRFDHMIWKAWIVQSYIYGVMPWRFHAHITAPAGSGKTQIMKWLSKLCGYTNVVSISTTPKGMQSQQGFSQAGILLDEFEPPSDKNTKRKVEEYMEIVRQSTSIEHAEKTSYTLHGDGHRSNNMVFMFGSIQSSKHLRSEAENQRIFDIAIDKQYQKPTYRQAEAICYDEMAIHRHALQTHLIKNLHKIKDARKVIRDVMVTQEYSNRQADVMSLAMALDYGLHMEDRSLEDYCRNAIDTYEVGDSSYMLDTNQYSLAKIALQTLFSRTLRLDGKDLTIASWIHEYEHGTVSYKREDIAKVLGSVGLRVMEINGRYALLLHNTCQSRNAILPKYPELGKLLKNDPVLRSMDLLPHKVVRIGGINGAIKSYYIEDLRRFLEG